MNSDQADILDLLAGHTDDSTIERLAFECLMTSLTDDRVASLMNVLGWRGDFDCFAIGGTPETSPASASLVARKAVRDLGGEHVIVGTYGSFLLALVCQSGAATAEVTCTSWRESRRSDVCDGFHVFAQRQFVGKHGEGIECASEYGALSLEACRGNDRLGCDRPA